MSAFLKKLTSKGTWRQVFICMRPPIPLPLHTVWIHTPVLIHPALLSVSCELVLNLALAPSWVSLGHLLKLKCAHSPLNLRILSSTSLPFTLMTVQVPNVSLVETKRFTVREGGGGRWTSENVRGVLVHRRGRKYQHDCLCIASL